MFCFIYCAIETRQHFLCGCVRMLAHVVDYPHIRLHEVARDNVASCQSILPLEALKYGVEGGSSDIRLLPLFVLRTASSASASVIIHGSQSRNETTG